jgi:AcrR family transcriptional regulator
MLTTLTLPANAVNITFAPMAEPLKSRRRRRPKTYHHGDLKAALLESALDILRDQGLEALTLRAVARRAGVSQAAPYRHFADRRALVAAVAELGFREMQARMSDAMQPAGAGSQPGLRQVAVAYVRFGLENPAVYRVMFGPEVANTEDLPELRATSGAALPTKCWTDSRIRSLITSAVLSAHWMMISARLLSPKA